MITEEKSALQRIFEAYAYNDEKTAQKIHAKINQHEREKEEKVYFNTPKTEKK